MSAQKQIQLACTLGNTIFYQVNGKFFVRSKPVTVKQTRATRQSARLFGLAQTAARNLRSAFCSLIPDKNVFDRKNILASPIHKWIINGGLEKKDNEYDLPFITGFELNSQCSFREKCALDVTVKQFSENGLDIQLPAFLPLETIKAPEGTVTVELLLGAASCNVKTKQLTGSSITSVLVNYNAMQVSEQILKLPLLAAGNNLIVLLMTMRYKTGNLKLPATKNMRKWMPAGIIAARYLS